MSVIRLVLLLATFRLVSMGGLAYGGVDVSTDVYRGLVSPQRVVILDSLRALSTQGGEKAVSALEALGAGLLRRGPDGDPWVLNQKTEKLTNLLSGEKVSLQDRKWNRPIINNRIRRVLTPSLATLRLLSENREVRLAAAKALNKRPLSSVIPTVKDAIAREQDKTVLTLLRLVLGQAQLNSDVRSERLAAITLIKNTGSLALKPRLEELLETNDEGDYWEKDLTVVRAARSALSSLERKEFAITQLGNLFYGLSLGSVLMLAALGLAVTFGLMGVINMAHGEMLMLGAYSTYFIQTLFSRHLPDLFEYYILAAIPFAFLATTFVGVVLEQTVIKHLYGRTLETLLATWGISLVLIQTVRVVFGAQNVEVANPSWLSGGVEVAHGLVLPFNRIAIMLFSALVITFVWFLMKRTSAGLVVRAVTQNRKIASCMGVDAPRVDMWTFAFGSGVAGLGGVALSQIGNVGPELGQAYIVDCFMVVVLGGVGEITGTVVGAFGLGVLNKFMEPLSGAVLGKIVVLIFIVLFIQKRPQGLFALKGRVRENHSA